MVFELMLHLQVVLLVHLVIICNGVFNWYVVGMRLLQFCAVVLQDYTVFQWSLKWLYDEVFNGYYLLRSG
jgi:hypothetical protein